LLEECLRAIARATDRNVVPYEVIVVFQQMTERAVEAFTASFTDIRALRPRVNLGFGGGNNFAARYARGRYLVLLNDDAVPQPGWLERLVDAAERDSSIGAVGSRILFPDWTVQEAGSILWSDGSCYPVGRGDRPGAVRYAYVRPVDFCSANGLLVRRDTFERAGGFDPRFFPAYYEDVDLCMTIRHRLGEHIVYEPRSVILHQEAATGNRNRDFRDFLFRRNKTALCEKWTHELRAQSAPQPDSPIAIERAILRARGNPTRVLVLDDRIPNAASGSGFGRTVDLLADLHDRDFAVSFHPCAGSAAMLENPLAGLGVDLILEPLHEHLARPEKRYDVIVISRPHNYERLHHLVRERQERALLIYDVEALYHRRLFLQAKLETDPQRRAMLEAEAQAMQALESSIARSCDRLVAISETEHAWLSGIENHAPIDFMRPLSRAEMPPSHLHERTNAVFVAGWLAGNASPNVEALRWYRERVVPLVRRQLPDFETLVTGSNPPLAVQAMDGNGIRLVGRVGSIASFYRNARIAVSPMLAGAGVKIKTIEALQHGVPVVATTVGAEGLGLSDGDTIDITDDPGEFAQRIVSLLSDDGIWLTRRNSFQRRVETWKRESISWKDVVLRAAAPTR
jgi:GT2 family glycosyltransferase